jgi:hypothetical protein
MFPGMKLAALVQDETMAEGMTTKYSLLQESNRPNLLAIVSQPKSRRRPAGQRDHYRGDRI